MNRFCVFLVLAMIALAAKAQAEDARELVKLSPAVTWNYQTQHGYGADSATTWTSGQGEIVRVYRDEITRFTA